MTREEKIEAVARLLCQRHDGDPDRLEPGNVIVQPWMDEEKLHNADYDHMFDDGSIPPDGYLKGDDPSHFKWREWIFDAKAVVELLEKEEGRSDG